MKERFNAEWKKIKAMEGPVKREYIWDYYKIHIIATIIVLAMLGSILNDTVINPPPRSALTIAWMSPFEPEPALRSLSEALYPAIVDNPARQTVQVMSFFMIGDPQHDMAQHQRFSAMSAARELDIIIGDFTEFEGDQNLVGLGLAPSWVFHDLRPILAEAGLNSENLLFGETDEGEELAFGISLEGSTLFEELGISTTGRYLGVVVNTDRYEAVIEAIRKLW